MFRTWTVLVAVLLVGPLAHAATIAVVGVVAYQPTGEYRAGVEVGLYCDDQKNCKLGTKNTTTTDGQYKLSKGNIAPLKLFVVYDGSEPYVADPVLVNVDCPQANEPCVLMAKKLLLRPLPTANNTQAIAYYLNAYGNTQSVKARAGVITAEKANEATVQEAAKVLGLSIGIVDSKQNETVGRVFEAIQRLPRVDNLEPVRVLSNVAEFGKIADHADFKKFREFKSDPSRLKNKDANLDDELRYFLSLPNEAVKMEWVNDERHLAIVSDYLRRMNAGESALLQFRGADASKKAPTDAPRMVLVSVPVADAMKPRELLEKHPELRAWVFYEMLLKEQAIPKDRTRLITDRLQAVRPVVVQSRK